MSHQQQLYPQETCIYLSSNSSHGGIINALKSEAIFYLNEPLDIEPHYRGYVSVDECDIWFVIPNVEATLYDNNTLEFSNDNGANWNTITFNNGLYDIDGLNSFISDYMINNGFVDNLISFQGIPADGHTQVTLGTTTCIIRWANSKIATLVGWTTGSPNTGPGIINQSYNSPNEANFNRLSNILIHCSLAAGSYFGTNGSSDIVAQIVPDVRPGNLIKFRPFRPAKTVCNTRHITSIRIRITDQDNNEIDLAQEDWNIRLRIDKIPR